VLSTDDAAMLLATLCTRLGFCLPPDSQARMTENPPADAHQFTAAVFIAEGLDPSTADRRTYRQVKAFVAEAFRRSEERRTGSDVP